MTWKFAIDIKEKELSTKTILKKIVVYFEQFLKWRSRLNKCLQHYSLQALKAKLAIILRQIDIFGPSGLF